MFNSKSRIKVLVLVGVLFTECLSGAAGKEGVSPLDELPGYIKQVTHFGQRADTMASALYFSKRPSGTFMKWNWRRVLLIR